MRSYFVSFFTDQDVPRATKGYLREPDCLWPGFVVYFVNTAFGLASLRLAASGMSTSGLAVLGLAALAEMALLSILSKARKNYNNVSIKNGKK